MPPLTSRLSRWAAFLSCRRGLVLIDSRSCSIFVQPVLSLPSVSPRIVTSQEKVKLTDECAFSGLPPDTFIKANVFFTVFYSKRIVGSYVGNRRVLPLPNHCEICEMSLLSPSFPLSAPYFPRSTLTIGSSTYRQDAVEALDFAARGKVTPRIEVCSLEQLPEGELSPLLMHSQPIY